ncbi:HET-domain-containing protein [Macroventuria anomochaeta]|uniref:HET-domain-containing protein n=1 Tax=Macroventuria anomochaeta TaxID=301207 RepID=A0ACB6RWW6_9PLEO|nr:HET-domain-containing protein [Macroventuria anomochaeta]KAF2625419.1 HET-domain-containing protein [Macroventuria anomochaeta]
MPLLELSRYRYEALPGDGGQHIRIARIYPGHFDDDIHVSLRIEDFQVDDIRPADPTDIQDQLPTYEAMSYTWGPPVDSGLIFVRTEISLSSGLNTQEERADQSWHQWLPARANLLSALRHLRRDDSPRDMWIDAICIDQEEVVQKGPQVALMGTLYSQAAGVVVWLGPACDESDRAMELLNIWGSQVDFDIGLETLQPSAGSARLPAEACDERMADAGIPLECRGKDSLAVSSLFGRDWFDRLWIRQEIGLADLSRSHVQCGTMAMPWAIFRNAWGAIYLKGTSDDDPTIKHRLNNRIAHVHPVLEQKSSIYLSWVRLLFSGAECFDKRDRIYAVRSMLADESIKQVIKPDYTKTVIETYRDAAMAYLREDTDRDLRILEDCRLHAGWSGPSWVPDWTYADQTVLSPWGYYRASMDIIPIPRAWEIADLGALRVQGVFVTKVTEVHATRSLEDVHNLLVCGQRSMDGAYPAGGTVLDAYARVLCCDRYKEIDAASYSNGPFPLLKILRDYLSQLQTKPLETSTREVSSFLLRGLTGRTLLQTDSGLIGLGVGQECAQVGDEICAIFGCGPLMVIRPSCNSRDGQYRLVGPCSLDGANWGESVLGPLPRGMRHVNAEVEVDQVRKSIWVCKDEHTGELLRMDPRLLSLGIDLTDYEKSLEQAHLDHLYVESEVLVESLATRGVHVQAIDLV